ncbi:MAG: methionyl-tRNA formyltransferase, partial [Limnochordales bacterium]|nr:methionyl-tRNA formyltransferase [Limnochordales bacterium]
MSGTVPPLRTVFMGTPAFAVPSLQALLRAGHPVVGVFTQPDRPRGRGHRLQPPPVKEAAVAAGIPVFQPRRLREPGVLETLRELGPDVICVVAYGQILPKAVLDVPPLGCINVHASLLPRFRGAAPIQAALLAGEKETGVTTMFMDEGLDTGDIILQRRVPIDDDDDAGTLHDKLAAAGAELLVETLRLLALGRAPRRPQDHGQASYAPKLDRAAAALDWAQPAEQVRNHVRAFAPWPGAYTAHGERILKVLQVDLFPGASGDAAPGEVIAVEEAGFVVQTGAGAVLVRRVQPPNAAPMSGRDYVNGYRLQVGQRLATLRPDPEGGGSA